MLLALGPAATEPTPAVKGVRNAVRRLGLNVSFQRLRHDFASMLLASELHLRLVQTELGHSNIQVTIDTDSHLLPGMGHDAASKIDSTNAVGREPERIPSELPPKFGDNPVASRLFWPRRDLLSY